MLLIKAFILYNSFQIIMFSEVKKNYNSLKKSSFFNLNPKLFPFQYGRRTLIAAIMYLFLFSIII